MSHTSISQECLSLRLSASYSKRPDILRDLELTLHSGEILGLVGQSGCGKSTLTLAILKLLHLKRGIMKGSLLFEGRDLMLCSERAMRAIRGKEMALVLQSPHASLNPALRIGTQMEEAWGAHRHTSRCESTEAIAETLDHVSLPTDRGFLRRYPSELSVGQAQRLLIGLAILHRPALLIADEPTSALDVLTQAEILQLFATLSRKLGTSILFISHDLLSVATISDRVAVMHQGTIVECEKTANIFFSPQHEYTQRLVAALPTMPQSKVI